MSAWKQVNRNYQLIETVLIAHKKIWVKNSWKLCGFAFALFGCWQLWFDEKKWRKILAKELVKMLEFCSFQLLTTFDLTIEFFFYFFRGKSSSTCCGFALFSCRQLYNLKKIGENLENLSHPIRIVSIGIRILWTSVQGAS